MLPSICSPPARSLPSLLRLLHTCPRVSVALRALSPTHLPFHHLHAGHHAYTCHSQLLHRLSLASASCVATSSPLTEAAASSSSKLSPAETFFADDGVTWKSLGLSQEVVKALERAQLQRPSIVQDVAIPSILTESDVVMAAETGSGKTQAYLAPLFDKLLTRRKINSKTEEDPSVQVLQHFALVLCPNGMLCEQVAEMANALCDGTGAPLLKASVISGGQGWPITPPDLVIATPAALMNHLFAFDPRRRRRNAFIRDVKYVVFDEADMLLSGGFENQVIRLLNLLRFEEKQLSKLKSQEAMLATVESQPLDARPWTEFEPAEVTSEDGVATEDLEGSLESDEDQQAESSDSGEDEAPRPGRNQKRDWFRTRKLYTRSKQYIFAAATLPENGKKTPGAVLRRLFPEAKWVNGLFLHRHNPRLQERWLEVDESMQVKALLDALAEDSSSFSDSFPKKTLVFANSVEAVDAIYKILQRSKIDCLCYHRDVPAEERTRSLKAFQEKGGVLVCTDAAARGLDIPNISHVIQAEFAKSAVEFLHRVGRTARAGQSGMVTSLYTKINKPLVEAVKQAKAAGLPVEGAFSRKRSFRNKLKRSELASR